MKGRIIDFYSGLGGASEAFVRDGRYQVTRIDSNPALKDVEYTYIRNIREMKWGEIELLYGNADLMIFGIPCYEFSMAYSAPRAIAIREGKKNSYQPDMKDLLIALEIIEYLQPKYWIIENVAGAITFFREYLGEPTQQIGPFVFWHNLPLLSLNESDRREIIGHKSKNDTGPSNPLRANYRAKWPISISRSLLKSFETPTLEDF